MLLCFPGLCCLVDIDCVENSYLEVLSWEALHKGEGPEPKLKSFGGKVMVQFVIINIGEFRNAIGYSMNV